MAYTRTMNGKVPQVLQELHFDETPTPGSLNPVTSGGVAESVGAISDVLPEGASAENKLVDQATLDEATAAWDAGYTPKGPASVSTLNGLSGQENGDRYVLTDGGTLTDGSLTVAAGDEVAWDATNSAWYLVNQYALKSDVKCVSVDYKSNGLTVTKKTANGKILNVSFIEMGPNSILQLKNVGIFDSDGSILSASSTGTDSVGPFQVSADENADGDNLNNPKFTGGFHGYNGDQTGTATASTVFKVLADGELKSASNFLCKHLEIVVSNNIQGWNTRKSDGTGREILQEVVRYVIDSDFDKIKVYNNISPLEDVTISLYYGMQIAFARDFVEFNSEKKSEWLAKNTSSSYVGGNLDSVDGKASDGFVQSMSVHPKGLGHFYYVPENTAKAFQSDKIYYNLIRQDLGLSVGESVFFEADYAFNFEGQKIESLKSGSYSFDNQRVDKYFSIEDLPEGTYKLKLYFTGMNPASYVNVYIASSHDSSGIIDTFSNVANGIELTISVTGQTKIIWIFSNTVITGRIDYLIYS